MYVYNILNKKYSKIFLILYLSFMFSAFSNSAEGMI
jgi:hypothetical protein